MDIKICIFLAGILLATFQGVLGRNHTVTFNIYSNESFNSVSDHGSKFLVGDTLVFNLEDENDGIARVMSQSEYEACRVEASKAVIFKGEKVKINVVAGSVVRKRSLSHGGSGHGGGGGGGSGGSGGSSGSPGGFTTPRGGNRSRPKDNAATAAALKTCSLLFVLLGLFSISFNVF